MLSRRGALRFRADGDNPFLAAGHGTIPPFVQLSPLLNATNAVHDETETAQDLRYLLGQGSSFGGARPKSAIALPDGRLAIARFPKPDDMLANGIRQFGHNASADLRELWRRLVFSLLASNYDDHLRNHGFLMREPGRWALSPLSDVNPVPEIDRTQTPKTSISADRDEPTIGTAQSILRPAGKAEFGGHTVDVITQGDFIDPGSAVRIVALDGLRVVVEKVWRPPQSSLATGVQRPADSPKWEPPFYNPFVGLFSLHCTGRGSWPRKIAWTLLFVLVGAFVGTLWITWSRERRAAQIAENEEWLSSAVIPQIEWNSVTAEQMVAELNQLLNARPDRPRGLRIVIASDDETRRIARRVMRSEGATPLFPSPDAVWPAPSAELAEFAGPDLRDKTIDLQLHEIPLWEAIRYTTAMLDWQMVMEPRRIVFHRASSERWSVSPLVSRTIRIPSVFLIDLATGTPLRPVEFLRAQGITVDSGCTATYDPRTQNMQVRLPEEQVDLAESIVTSCGMSLPWYEIVLWRVENWLSGGSTAPSLPTAQPPAPPPPNLPAIPGLDP